MSTFTYHKPGIGNAASYQVAGVPWYTSSVAPDSGDIITISMPRVTKFVTVKNCDTVSSTITVGFDLKQLEYETGEYFQLGDGESISLDVKVTDIYLQSKNSVNIPFTIVAGLTNIERREMPSQLVTSDIGLTAEQGLDLTTEDDFVIILE